MGLGGEASHLRHEADRNQNDLDNGRITLIALIIIAIMTLVCVVGCISEDVERQEAIDAAEQTEETTATEETTEQTQTEERADIPAEEPDEESASEYPAPPPDWSGEYNEYPSEEEIYGYPSREEWQEELLEDAYKAYGEQQGYDDLGAPY